MKGIVILKPLEFILETIGEKWRQGEKLVGTLSVINHGSDVVELSTLKVSLLSGNYKKVKAKDVKAFEKIIEKVLEEKISLNKAEKRNFNFEFLIPEDARITDKDGSIYLAYFDKDDSTPIGNIELTILPKLMMMQFLEIMDNFLRFKIGVMKFSKGMVEVKLTPPASKEFSQVESLILRMKESEKKLGIEYHFTTKKIEMSGGTMSTEKVASKFDQTISAKQFYIYGDSVNQDGIINLVNSILNEVKPKFLL